MRRFVMSLMAVALVAGVFGVPNASAQQSVNFYIGGFNPHGFDARGTDDVLYQNANFLDFSMHDFNSVTVGGEWLIALNDNIEAGLGVGVFSRSVPGVYANWVNPNGTDIVTDQQLRIVPLSATVRWLPVGRRAGIVPYVGAGVGVMVWHYSESGQFVDPTDNSIFRDTFTGSGANAGPVILGGVRFPIGVVDIGGEVRYQGGRGTLPASEGFAGPKIDLGGFNYLATVNVRF